MSSKRKPTESVVPSAGRKQGREGSDEPQGRTAVKRQRVSRACDQCRAAREKCDGIQPLCFPCVSQNRPCTYQANPKKRGVQTGYIRTLELALAWIFEKVTGSEDALSSFLAHEGGHGQRLLTGSESAAASRLHQKWRRSRVHRDIDRILSGGESTSAQDDKSLSLDDATDTDGEANSSFAPSLTPVGSSRVLSLPPASRQAYQSPYAEERCMMSERGRACKETTRSLDPHCHTMSLSPFGGLKLPSNHWRLMDIYFSYTHCWLPILEKQEIFQASYLYSADHGLELTPENAATSTHAELWSALALASYQDVASSRPSAAAQSDSPGNMTPDQIYNVARSLVPGDDGTFQIHHARALILLSLVNLGRRNFTSSWLLIGKAVRIVLDISSRDGFGHKQQQRLRSVFIACFIMDTMVSQQYRKPPHLTAEDMTEAMNISENDLDEWQPWAACEGFGQGGDGSLLSRNPAYCLSTFNQLYEIFKVISRSIAMRRAKAEHHPGSATGRRQLQQAINLQAPFGTYILSADVESAHLPSPYLLKILYLWATGLVDTISRSTARLIMAVIEKYQGCFGTCALPPFIAPCLYSWATHPGFENLNQQEKARIVALQDSHAATWDTKQGSSPSSNRTRGLEHTSLAHKQGTEIEHRPKTVLPSIGSSISVPPGELPSQGQGVHNLSSPYLIPPYANQRGILSPTIAVMARDRAQDTINDMETTMAVRGAVDLQPHYHLAQLPNLTAGSTDYDALLDDLASIDYADRIEADPQFMLNLGFAPGCDLNEVLSLDFTGFQ